jgi:DNA-binding CsgD family transcriptional regulator
MQKIADASVVAYQTAAKDKLIAAGYSLTETDDILKITDSPLTKENALAKLDDLRKMQKIADASVVAYQTAAKDKLIAAGYSLTETDDILKIALPALTKENALEKLNDQRKLLTKAEDAIKAYQIATTKKLTDAGYTSVEAADILKIALPALTKENAEEQLKTTIKLLTDADAAVIAYITATNGKLTKAGFGKDDLLKPSEVVSVTTAVDNAAAAYTLALTNVTKWTAKLEELGISFTPYGTPADVGLITLTANFLTAQTAFNTANTAISTWVDSIRALANSITAPTVPKIEPIIKADTTAGTGTTAVTHVRPSSPGYGYIWEQTGPNADDGFWYEPSYVGDVSGGDGGVGAEALGGVFNSGSRMAFANGGAFSNSIVDTPTKFRMGLMGEAGPEAIMPLTRGPDGSLGVTAQMPNFNNNSNEANMVLVNEIKELRNEVAKLRVIAGQNEYNTRKTKETLQLVTVGGEYMQTKTVT